MDERTLRSIIDNSVKQTLRLIRHMSVSSSMLGSDATAELTQSVRVAAWKAARTWDETRGPLDKHLAVTCRSECRKAAYRLQSQARGYPASHLQYLRDTHQVIENLPRPVSFDTPSADPDFSLAEILPGHLPDLESLVIEKREFEAFNSAVNELSESDRDVMLRVADGWMDTEIAEERGVSHQAIAQRRQKATERVRKTLLRSGEIER